MANAGHKNLIPLNKRTKDAQRKIRSKGGAASAEKRRQRKALKDSMNALLELPITNARDFNAAARLGIPLEDLNNSQLIVVALFKKAKSGDVAAIKELRDLIGEAGEHTDEAALENARRLLEDIDGAF